MLLFSTKVSQAAFTKVIMPVIGRKGTNKRAKYKIKIILFLLSSESTLSKGTNKRGKYQRKINFSLNFRAKVPSLKVRLSEENTKGKHVFCQLFQERCQLFQEKCQLFQEIVNEIRKTTVNFFRKNVNDFRKNVNDFRK